MKTFADYGIQLPAGSAGRQEISSTCPECSHERRKKSQKCLSVNPEKGTWFCHHCGWKGHLEGNGERALSRPSKTYQRPYYKSSVLPSKALRWFKGRGISEKVLEHMQIGFEGEFIKFPYLRDGQVVNIKSRKLDGKKFFQEKDAERVLYNLDGCAGAEEIVWVEGEMDALALIAAGVQNVVSVPDGAPSGNSKDFSSKFDFLDNCSDFIEGVKTHILALDKDEPGERLGKELSRRLGIEKCKKVAWPEGCKDGNDVLVTHGAEIIRQSVAAAKDLPISGIVTVQDTVAELFDIFENGPRPSYSCGWKNLDEFYRVRPGELTVVTGIPSHGKSEVLDAVMMNMADSPGWRFGIFSPENYPVALHQQKLIEKHVGAPLAKGIHNQMSSDQAAKAAQYLSDKFFWIMPEDEAPTIETILEKARLLVLRHGVNGLVIDPWNEIEHSRPHNMTETEYISQSLSQLRRFGRMNDVHVWLVAHPTKLSPVRKEESAGHGHPEVKTYYPIPTPYDIAGSAHFRNKADNCLTVHRHDMRTDKVTIYIQKIRFKDIGKNGEVSLNWSRDSGRYFDSIVELGQQDTG